MLRAVLMQVFDNRPGYADAVVGRSAAAKLVEEYQRPTADIVEYRGGLVHLHHECRLAQRYVVAGSHTGEYLVNHAYVGAVGCHKAAYLGHDYVEGGLAQQCRLTRHVWTGNHHHLGMVVVQFHRVAYIEFTRGQLALDYRMCRASTSLSISESSTTGRL